MPEKIVIENRSLEQAQEILNGVEGVAYGGSWGSGYRQYHNALILVEAKRQPAGLWQIVATARSEQTIMANYLPAEFTEKVAE